MFGTRGRTSLSGTGTSVTLIPAGTGKAKAVKACIMIAAATTIQIKRGSTAVTGAMPFNANDGILSDAIVDGLGNVIVPALPETNPGEALTAEFGVSVAYSGWVEYLVGA